MPGSRRRTLSAPRRLRSLPARHTTMLLRRVLVIGLAIAAPAAAQLQPAVRVVHPSAPLGSPPRLPDLDRAPRVVEVSLTAAPVQRALLPGSTTSAFAYNGTIPGPTLDVREGDRVIVHFRNDLPEPTTVHWHGLHIPVTSDGSPYDPVPPGGTRDYVFTPARGSAGTYWYHPHPHHRTGYQVAQGLFGAIVVRAADDPLPASIPERLLILSDNRFLAGGTLDFPEHHSHQGRIDRENGREGDVLFVNGQLTPTISIRAGEVQRWRVINASAARVYRLAIPGHRLLHVGSDGGLFERPVEVDEVLVASSERVELLVRGTGSPGSRTTLQALPYDRYIPQTRPADWNRPRDLLAVQYTSEPPMRPLRLPATLRRIPALDVAHAPVTRVISLSQGMINGHTMEMGRVDVRAPLGATEIWQIENLVGMDHPFHLHGFQFQVLDRDGVPEPFRAWKDTVNVRRHETVRFIVRYDDFPGRWMFHCHILDHEDHGMMGVLEVT
jgi:FtsP/CotA-like multicopper oxidase with cupredoxin domain